MNNLFPLQNSWLLVLAFLLAAVSIVLSNKDKDAWAIASLFFAAFALRLFMAHLDPFLHDWDERFHALVARNMMDYPFRPMMRVSTLFPYDYTAWCCNHIWLHKQPLFLWQMALSMKIFGVSEFAIRYPSVLMGSIGVLLIYRITLLLTENKKTAFLAALFTCFSYYHLELLSGYYGMDQNDVCFDFYVLASIWAYTEYLRKPTWYWAALAGLLSGAAMLTKWLVGLLVFSAWVLLLLPRLRRKEAVKEILHFVLALILSAVVFLPWQ
ncbi:MAG: glycosyltransferase family 39 protein, partial [Bacteroidetes bacterium]|nr:glycosyltransferase family 39 protein [Bacteroidota bacterium]